MPSSSSTRIAVTTSGGPTCACGAMVTTPTCSPSRAAGAARPDKVRAAAALLCCLWRRLENELRYEL